MYYWTYDNVDIVSGLSEAEGGTVMNLGEGGDHDLLFGDYVVTAYNVETGCFADTTITVSQGFTPELEDGARTPSDGEVASEDDNPDAVEGLPQGAELELPYVVYGGGERAEQAVIAPQHFLNYSAPSAYTGFPLALLEEPNSA